MKSLVVGAASAFLLDREDTGPVVPFTNALVSGF
jgi:hypothetical protein